MTVTNLHTNYVLDERPKRIYLLKMEELMNGSNKVSVLKVVTHGTFSVETLLFVNETTRRHLVVHYLSQTGDKVYVK